MTQSAKKNRLKDEASLYLRQHADQPVDWYPWGPEAFIEARESGRPIFLSVGYSSCHWCHVMNRESFSNPEIADYLNKHFVSIKVDREERPDVDTYYQQACQLFTKKGGWPLSAFLLSDARPFFVSTYFPPHTSQEQTGFLDLLKELVRAHQSEQEKVLENAGQITEMIKKGLYPTDRVEFPGHFPGPSAILAAVDQFYDKENGGYGAAPKFPHFPFWEWALEQMLEGMVERSFGEKVITSLEKMLMGGMIDHVRGGVHRYSTDVQWKVPHFEKMLYDQAGYLRMLTKLGLLFPSPLVFDNMILTLEYLEAEMLSEKNYFFSAQDAESEGVEGLYFMYTKEEFEDALNKGDDQEESLSNNLEKLGKYFGVTEQGNFEHRLNVLSLNFEQRQEIFTQAGVDLLRKARRALLDERKTRIPPATDSKGVASWNFLMAQALIDVVAYTQIDVIRQRASQLLNRLLQGVFENFVERGPEGMRLHHTTTRSNTPPLVEDVVMFGDMSLRLFEITGNPIFKDNVRETISFVEKEFIQEGELLTRAKSSSEHEPHPNLVVQAFDGSFRSPLSTYVGLVRRARVLFQDSEVGAGINRSMESLPHAVLKNPISGGEGLRALTYPDSAYRVVQVPLHWLKDEQFVRFMPYFLPRFVLDYLGTVEKPSDESWQIAGLSGVELKGVGLAEFIQTLAPPKPETPNP
jgi:uncharacterized protein